MVTIETDLIDFLNAQKELTLIRNKISMIEPADKRTYPYLVIDIVDAPMRQIYFANDAVEYNLQIILFDKNRDQGLLLSNKIQAALDEFTVSGWEIFFPRCSRPVWDKQDDYWLYTMDFTFECLKNKN
jgi:hypothetical protein